MTEVLVSLITGGITLVGVLISNGKAQAVTDERISELTREVRKHNNFAERVPVIEEQIRTLQGNVGELKEYHK